MRGWWARQSPEKKRAVLDARRERRGEALREADRRRGRRAGPRGPLQTIAGWKVANAVRSGRLVKQPCEVCGAEPVQAHHDDYERPLDIRWLCSKHHGEVHRKYPTEAVA